MYKFKKDLAWGFSSPLYNVIGEFPITFHEFVQQILNQETASAVVFTTKFPITQGGDPPCGVRWERQNVGWRLANDSRDAWARVADKKVHSCVKLVTDEGKVFYFFEYFAGWPLPKSLRKYQKRK